MAVFQEPTQWDHELGNNADVSTLPDDTSATTGVASLQKLFQIINQTPLEAGGVAPDREDFNALFKYLGDQIFYTQNGGVPSYNNSYDYAIGRVVLYNDNIYKCIQPNTVTVGSETVHVAPDSDDTYWLQLDSTQSDSTSLIPNQIISSPVPLTDANLHLLDGALLSGSGAYSAYVDLIAELYNGGTATSSFCTEAEWQASNTAYGFCNKFVYDSVANTVRLPKVNSEHGALIKSYANGYNWYRIYQDGWCEQGLSKTPTYSGTWTFLVPFSDTNYTALQSNRDNSQTEAMVLKNFTTTSVAYSLHTTQGYQSLFACGYVDITDLQTAPIYEYIVVGTIVKTEIQIDIDQVMADLALKADTDLSNVPNSKGILVESYVNGTSWYRVYSDGWCEQGGFVTAAANYTITFLKTFVDANYTPSVTLNYANSSSTFAFGVVNLTSSSMVISTFDNVQGNSRPLFWQACGYIS